MRLYAEAAADVNGLTRYDGLPSRGTDAWIELSQEVAERWKGATIAREMDSGRAAFRMQLIKLQQAAEVIAIGVAYKNTSDTTGLPHEGTGNTIPCIEQEAQFVHVEPSGEAGGR